MERAIAPSESVSEAVVRAVSSAEDCSPRALPSLYGVVNPEALNALFNDDRGREDTITTQMSFQFSDSVVTVSAEGCIQVEQHRAQIGSQ